MNFKRFIALSLVIVMTVCCFPISSFSVKSAEIGCTLDYTFIGDEKDVAGFAQGLITVTPNSNGAQSGYYLVYYTDGTNVLGGYDELASAKITGSSVRMEIKDGTLIPQGAKGIAVFESQTKFLDNPPAITTAKAKCDIPASKQLDLTGEELVFGLASDVHMNYEALNPSAGAFKKWENALKFFKQNGATHVIVTGDMTGDASDGTTYGDAFSLESQYKKYAELIANAGYTKDAAIECLGNHSNTTADRGLFTTYTSGANEVHPFAGSGYFYVLLKGKNGAKDNLFIALQQELDGAAGGYKASQSANVDNFSKEQMDWFEGLLKTYGNDKNTNVFVLCHSPFRNYGAGEKYNGSYSALTTFKADFPQNMRLKALLETYKDVTVFSGHTHQSLYDNLNYSNMANTFAHTVHAPSPTAPRAYKEDGSNVAHYDGRKGATATYGSESYVVKVYKDYVVYMGYNLSTGKCIPAGCMIVPTKTFNASSSYYDFEGSGTKDDPYLIQNESDFMVFTNGMNSSNLETDKYGEGKYFKQTADINMIGIESYLGTHANGGAYGTGTARFYFGGHYDGNGYEIKVTIKGPEQRSVFPYIYGTLCNVVIRGDIVSDAAAQPIRANRGSVVNCVFDCYLQADMVNGVAYSNYTYLYNVYTSGMLNGATSNNVVSSNNDGSAYVWNVFHNYIKTNGEEISDNVGTRSNNLAAVADTMNIRDTVDYKSAAMAVAPGVMSEVGVINGQLRLGHDGKGPVDENMPKSGNITNYGYYTISPLYRQGGADVNWDWDENSPIAYPDETGKTLTDGKFATTLKYSDAAWVGFHAKTPSYVNKGYHSFIITFGDEVDIEYINVYVGTSALGSGVSAPSNIELLCDGVSVGSTKPTDVATDANTGTEKVVIKVENKVKKLELRFQSYSWAMVSEVEVMTYEPNPHTCQGVGDWQSDETNHWKNCDCGNKTDVSSHDDGELVVISESQVGVKGLTELRCTVCGHVIKTIETPAIGDVNNDGKLNTADYMMLKSLVIGNIDLTDLKNNETAAFRCDFNGDGKIVAADYFLLKKHLLS